MLYYDRKVSDESGFNPNSFIHFSLMKLCVLFVSIKKGTSCFWLMLSIITCSHLLHLVKHVKKGEHWSHWLIQDCFPPIHCFYFYFLFSESELTHSSTSCGAKKMAFNFPQPYTYIYDSYPTTHHGVDIILLKYGHSPLSWKLNLP